MVHFEFLVVLLFIPFVCGLSPLAVHRNVHAAESVRFLQANETVHVSGSDILFSWMKCVLCDGYDARLYLQDISGTRMIPHQLKAAVTSLKITNLPPRTVYKLVVKRLPSDLHSSEISGRTFSKEAPLPVENLVAHALTSSSIQIEWSAQSADGFIAKIFLNDTLLQEKVIPDFSNHSVLNITVSRPATQFRVEVTAYYFPPTKNSMSPVSMVHVKTLPAVLPRLQLTWEFGSELKLSWNNPQSPAPVLHKLNCTGNSTTFIAARLSGSTNFVAVSNVTASTEIDCTLETWFSVDDRAKVRTRITAIRPERTNSRSNDAFFCSYWGSRYTIETSMNYKLEQVNGMESVLLTFSESHDGYLTFIELQYKLCEQGYPCSRDWVSLPKSEFPSLRLGAENLKAWAAQTLQYRFAVRCSNNKDNPPQFTTVRSFEIPVLVGPVDPVTEIAATASAVSWNYSRTSASPDYFLVTYCVENDCGSQSVPGKDRSVNLGGLKENGVYYFTVQAVQLRDHQAYISPTEMVSIIAPESGTSENVALSYTEVNDSPTVRLHIAHRGTPVTPVVAAYHVRVCSKPVPLWNESSPATLLSSNGSCETMVPTNSSIDLVREPWTTYEISVSACYAAFDSNEAANLTLPILKQNPSPIAGVSWTQETALLSWKYKAPNPSGFSISICPSRNGAADKCSDSLVGPTERQYHVDASDLSDNGFVVFVTPYVIYEGVTYNGTRSELAVNLRGVNSPDQA